ncbi:apolipoprotein C-I [Eucyclogobius newberryi]|uniref:apolipoprotein C-I n=1 Tax=Eucyclogobius newberryi TaxID=166745 RepID=UPI003B5C77F8
MKLYLAIAVLMLAFVAYTEVAEASVENRFNQFGQQVTDFGKTVAEKAKSAMSDFNQNENVQKAKNWFQERLEAVKAKFN